jgi:hypothetical protein
VACVRPEDLDEVRRRADEAGVAGVAIGVAGGDRLVVTGLVDVGLSDAVAAWTGALPGLLDAAAG